MHFCRIEQKENHLFETEIYCNKLYCLFSFIYWILAEYLKKKRWMEVYMHFNTTILYFLCKHFIFYPILHQDQLIMPRGSSLQFIPQYFVLINDFSC